MAKETDCNEISPDTQVYVIQPALMGLDATTCQESLIVPARVEECASEHVHQLRESSSGCELLTGISSRSHDLTERGALPPGSPSGCDS